MCTACLTPDPQVLLPCEHPAEGAGRTALLPVPSEPNGAEVNKKHLSAATANGSAGCSPADCRPAGCSGGRPHQVRLFLCLVSDTNSSAIPLHSLSCMSHSSRNSVKRESEDESMATPTGPSDEPTDLSVGGGREREERDRERQERERYYR